MFRLCGGIGAGKRITRIGIGFASLAAASAMALVVAGLALAAVPEVGRCVAQPRGKYKDANCAEKTFTGKGQFEFTRNPLSKAFNASGGEAVWQDVSGGRLVCEATSARGEYLEKGTTPSTREVHHLILTFTGCTLPSLATTCQSAGAAAGEVDTLALKGPLGYISGEKTTTPVVGVQLTPEKLKGLFAEFKCLNGGETNQIRGAEGTIEGRHAGNCVIGAFQEVNVMSTTFAFAYNGKEGQQEPQHFQPSTAKLCNLIVNDNGGAFERFAWTFGLTLSNGEALEIKA